MTPYDRGYRTSKAVALLRFMPGGEDYEALVYLPYLCFAEYELSNEQIQRGKVRRVGRVKWCAQGDLNLDREPSVQNGWKPFRDELEYDWEREEYVLAGSIRGYPTLTDKKYRAKNNVDSATPPPNDEQNWEEAGDGQ